MLHYLHFILVFIVVYKGLNSCDEMNPTDDEKHWLSKTRPRDARAKSLVLSNGILGY